MSWKLLEEIDARIEKLRTRAEKMTRPLPAESRELVSVLYQEVSFFEGERAEQRQTFYNGDRDTLVIQRLAATVSVEYPPGSSFPPFSPLYSSARITLQKLQTGWGMLGWGLELAADNAWVGGFDFNWNYVVNSRQSLYSRDPCSSDMLVGLDKGQMLDLRLPLVIPKSESVEFRVQPLRYPLPGSSVVSGSSYTVPGARYFVGFHGLGYRSMP